MYEKKAVLVTMSMAVKVVAYCVWSLQTSVTVVQLRVPQDRNAHALSYSKCTHSSTQGHRANVERNASLPLFIVIKVSVGLCA